MDVVRDITNHMPGERSGIYAPPTENDFRDWRMIGMYFKARALDSCKLLLAKQNYVLTPVKDAVTGSTYEVIREKYPVQKGWGTFIYNRNHAKRLNIHVNHPLDDPNVLTICADMFRRLNAEWLMIGGTSKRAVAGSASADVGLTRRTIFEQWHETFSDLTRMSVSVHGFPEKIYPQPINSTDVIVSNGKTTDNQWGISQISLAFRDTLRLYGMSCSLAMYDSGYARLAGGWNPQGVFSNDSLGFGHWLYVELSGKVREQPAEYFKFIAAADHALDLTGKKISQQVNRAFGLVSPRVVRVDSLHRMLFPPANAETYRIISFDPGRRSNDTIDVRLGNWVGMFGSSKSVAAITRLDSTDGVGRELQHARGSGVRGVVSKIVEDPPPGLPSVMNFAGGEVPDSSRVGEDEGRTSEPLQVHRIPLQPVLASTYTPQLGRAGTPFRWEGFVPKNFNATIPTFEISTEAPSVNTIEGFPKFLIPIINSSYQSGQGRYIGIQMTRILVKEIARLVLQNQMSDKDVGLLAEQSEQGEYYLRIFPAAMDDKIAQNEAK